ncbi:MAG TPA: carbon-nitrogen hydrolase family protein [Methylomusa anaerophila]|uniref:N-carbamoyl-D-amino acid hydrolase n=1 Tax=Methylomusa anaerophila TaxID=1930071 RepID=A0A348AL82_9FIRM|nr:carbon-nitrogen hydrolase family protein [Methylomusa anaerophila]BBB91830.1 N-carbamoyl-D-amino acid hydrolase [Methylomusa anaerophila]HML88437.1 carbon-nitrogen hydrolase family protein [Methylomusa anaerophila]
MRIALLHLDLSGGPEERNLALLQQAVTLAAQAGANWVVTPETALQGYFFTQKNRPFSIPVQPAPNLQPLRCVAAAYGLTVFLGCGEQDAASGLCYNSCLVMGSDGEIIGRHRKMHSHGTGAEGWAAKGTVLEPLICKEMTAGVLVCADAYFAENAQTLRAKQAQVILVPAAWPPGHCGGLPVNAWERCSQASGLPVWVCNQTGNREVMDMSQAQSAVVVGGKLRLAYHGLQQAVLLFDWDGEQQRLLSAEFNVRTI